VNRYALAEPPFLTIQGEGSNVGRAALFVRFAGCNLWSGRELTRNQDAVRTGSRCPRFCDTDFRPQLTLSGQELADLIAPHRDALIVFTGGEPLLQLDNDLIARLPVECELAVETNGTVDFKPGVRPCIAHVCVSPKVGPERLVVRHGNELKVVFPSYSPLAYEVEDLDFEHLFVQPEAIRLGGEPDPRSDMANGLDSRNVAGAVEFVKAHPRWCLSYQVHKAIGVP
jgi:organic radical activating enzyme